MKTIASRMLAAAPGKVWDDLEREGAIVITKDDVPRSIMLPTSDRTLLDDGQELAFARARRAIRGQAAAGSPPVTAAEIDREIGAVRRARRRRG